MQRIAAHAAQHITLFELHITGAKVARGATSLADYAIPRESTARCDRTPAPTRTSGPHHHTPTMTCLRADSRPTCIRMKPRGCTNGGPRRQHQHRSTREGGEMERLPKQAEQIDRQVGDATAKSPMQYRASPTPMIPAHTESQVCEAGRQNHAFGPPLLFSLLKKGHGTCDTYISS